MSVVKSKVLSIGIMVADLVGKPIDGMPVKGELEFLDKLEIHTGLKFILEIVP